MGTIFQSGELILAGHCICSLSDFTLQGTMAAWSVLDTSMGHEFAELTLKYTVFTTPGPIEKPVTAGVSDRQAILRWLPPINDYGSPVTDYQIEMLVDRGKKKSPKWKALYRVTGLQ